MPGLTGKALLFAGLITVAVADDSAVPMLSGEQGNFDIPSQALSTALSDYSAVTGIGVLVIPYRPTIVYPPMTGRH